MKSMVTGRFIARIEVAEEDERALEHADQVQLLVGGVVALDLVGQFPDARLDFLGRNQDVRRMLVVCHRGASLTQKEVGSGEVEGVWRRS